MNNEYPPPIALNSRAEVLYEGKVVGILDVAPIKLYSAEGVDGLVSGMVVEVQLQGATESGIVVVDNRGTWIELC